MKKKLLVLAVAGIMSASVMTACGGKETAATTVADTTTVTATTAAETTATAETTAAEATTEAAEATEEDKAITNFDEYISWTNKEWEAADDEEKLNAAIAYSVYTTEQIQLLGGVAADEETRALSVAEMRKAPDIMNVVDQLTTTLPSFADMSLKSFADTAVEQIKVTMESEAGAESKAE